MKKQHKHDAHEFQPLLVEIEDAPLNPLGRNILWLVVGVIGVGILWLSFGKIDVVVSARGKVVPSGEIKILQPIETGVISGIFIQEGEMVKKGQVLMQIDPSVTETSLESKQKDVAVLEVELQRLEALVEERPFVPNVSVYTDIIPQQHSLFARQYGTLKETRAQYHTKITQADAQLQSAKSDVLRMEGLLHHEQLKAARMEEVLDLIAKKEYEATQSALLNLQEQLTMAHHKLTEASQRCEEMRKEAQSYEERLFSEWHTQRIEKEKELRALESEVNAIRFQNKQQQIIAPLDGYVGKLLVHTEGGVVAPAEKLVSIIPKNAPLIIRATVLNQDIGFIAKGMAASLKIDTFTFQKYGFIDGNVTAIAHDAIEDEKLGPVYEVKIDPLQTTLEVEGKTKSLEPGMSVTAEIKVGKRRIIEFFIYPIIRYLDEGLSVR